VDAIASRDGDLPCAGGRVGMGMRLAGCCSTEMWSIADQQRWTLRAHQTQEFGGVNLANIAEMLGYSDDLLPIL
jgi:hypothetical protein